MTILASYSIKGGVGKTALSVNLSFALREMGKRTLLVDLDPQSAASFYFRVESSAELDPDMRRLADAGWEESIRESDYPGLDVLPSSFAYRHLDVLLASMKKSRKQLKRALSDFGGGYDFVVLDCPPNITLLSENAFRAADCLLVPVIPTTLSVRTLDQLREFLVKEEYDPGMLLPVFSMVQANKRLHVEVMEDLRARYPAFLSTTIPFSTDVERMGLERRPLLAYAPGQPASIAFRELAHEIVRRVEQVP